MASWLMWDCWSALPLVPAFRSTMLRGDQDARRIASPGMLLKAEPLPHLICSRPMFIGGVKDEADQHGDAGRVGGSDSGAIFAGGQDGAEPYPRRVHGGYGLSPQARDAAPSGGSTESAFWPTTWAADL